MLSVAFKDKVFKVFERASAFGLQELGVALMK